MNPTRDKIDGDLAALIDGTLAPDEAAQVKAWLQADPQLSEQVAAMIADRDALRGIPKIMAPTGLAEGVLAQLERGTLLTNFDRDITVHRGRLRNRLAIAALIAVVIGGFSYVVVQGITAHKGPWGDWANSQIAVNPPKKDPLKELLPTRTADVGPIASADQAQSPQTAVAPADASAADKKRDAQTEETAVLSPAAPAPAASPANTPTGTGGPLLATAGNQTDTLTRQAGEQLHSLQRARTIAPQDALAPAAIKDPANTKAALEDVACANLHFDKSGPPLTLALASQSPEDAERLQRLLQTFAQNLPANAPAENPVGSDAKAADGTAPSDAAANSNAAEGNLTGQSDSLRNDQQSAAQNAAGKTALNAQSDQNQQSAGNRIAALQQFLPPSAQFKQEKAQQEDAQKRSLDEAVHVGAETRHAANNSGDAGAGGQIAATQDAELVPPSPPGTYHVRLTQQQIEAVISAFTVRTVARGDVLFNIDADHPVAAPAYAVNIAPANPPATATAEAATPSAGAAAPNDFAARETKDKSNTLATTSGSIESPQPFQSTTTSLAKNKSLEKDDTANPTPALVDCLITLTPTTQSAK